MASDFLHFLNAYGGSVSIGIIAISFLVLGLRGVVRKRPFLISRRVTSLSWVAFFCAITVTGEMPSWWLAVTYSALLIIWLFMGKGYVAFGVTDASLREGLLASLTKLNLTYEDTATAIRLPTIGADLQVTGPLSWGGSGVVKMELRHFDRVLRDIAKGMNEYYRSGTAVEVNMSNFIAYLVIGGLFALLALGLAFHKVL
jgi:hypothetical protein